MLSLLILNDKSTFYMPALLTPTVIAIDVMGGDFGARSTLPALISALKDPRFSHTHFMLYGDAAIIGAFMVQQDPKKQFANRYTCVHCSEVVHMGDDLSTALRKKKHSSMRMALNALAENAAHVCVSSGNTGALMALARYVLHTLPGIDRPAIATLMPNRQKTGTIMLDLGANANCQAHHLLEFARMGHVMAQSIYGLVSPKIGLLNIGEELIKGNDMVKQALPLLQNSGLNFYGNVEGNEIFSGAVDVVVCDGFVGNIALKTAEGVAKMFTTELKQTFTKNWLTKTVAILVLPLLNTMKKNFDHRRYNGAMLLGLQGLVVKSHGGADAVAFFHALCYAQQAAGQNMLAKMRAAFAQ